MNKNNEIEYKVSFLFKAEGQLMKAQFVLDELFPSLLFHPPIDAVLIPWMAVGVPIAFIALFLCLIALVSFTCEEVSIARVFRALTRASQTRVCPCNNIAQADSVFDYMRMMSLITSMYS